MIGVIRKFCINWLFAQFPYNAYQFLYLEGQFNVIALGDELF